ncbi:hypothetical protein [Indiicoccus explosivorum]|uniref:hypothetical protein n=1 Tax=Indiicoccus explosivorum TaxID=1917864 RepID=UPI000B42E2F2|nr:hypothetical protein [Indiicoccus explosivorum]
MIKTSLLETFDIINEMDRRSSKGGNMFTLFMNVLLQRILEAIAGKEEKQVPLYKKGWTPV